MRAPTKRRRMIQRERQRTQGFREKPCAGLVAESGSLLKKGYRFFDRQHVERNFLGPSSPVGKARRDEQPRPRGRQQIGDLRRARDVVVDEEPGRALLGERPKRRLRRLLDVGLVSRHGPERYRERRQAGQETRAAFGRAPPYA